jgi:hypothetical protein
LLRGISAIKSTVFGNLKPAMSFRAQEITVAASLQDIAEQCGATTVIVQADHGDEPAIAQHFVLGQQEVMHFAQLSPPAGGRRSA